MSTVRTVPAVNAFSSVASFFDFLPQAERSALLIDYDGTLAPFTQQRDAALPYPGMLPLLDAIKQAGTHVAIVSGRPASEVVRLLGSSDFEVWGSHAFEHVVPGQEREVQMLEADTAEALFSLIAALESQGLGEHIERKPCGIAIHWRGETPTRQAEIDDIVVATWAATRFRAGLLLRVFDGGREIRVAAHNKRDAVRATLNELPNASAVAYLGDDHTDEDAFQELGQRGLSVLVRPEYRPTAAKFWLRPPVELTEFLSRWATSLEVR